MKNTVLPQAAGGHKMAEAQEQKPQDEHGVDDEDSNEAGQSANGKCDDKQIPWRLVSVVLIAAVVLLVGLPIGTVLIVNLSGCCLTSGPEHIITFWASMIAGFLTLFGMVITGVFVLTAFKTEANAANEARKEARKTAKKAANEVAREVAWGVAMSTKDHAVKEAREAAEDVARGTARLYLRDHRAELISELDKMEVDVKGVAGEVKDEMRKVTGSVRELAEDAQRQIGSAREDVGRLGDEAKEAIDRAQQEASIAAETAHQQIDSAKQVVENKRDEVIDAIGQAQQEVDAARQRFDRTAGDPPEEEGDPT